ncbi:disulfide bond formation protein B [Curvibacter sp. RS43]|uniref:disulfide bond formation protein B n=1 Tax=Curvibacter microcysteis TaxID=3026419 RepID=UPI0023613433|nr:disulfide bond formation protein B [Curvibacter sp. RS43]MDD0809783.1 disulfide bond formation protein B [Curvibacter sp. RS43]
MFLLNWFDRAPRLLLALASATCLALLAFGLYLQHVVGLEPCPMCIVQRYALLLVAVWAALAALSSRRGAWLLGSGLILVTSAFGAFVAARQSWLQWNPPEIMTCGRDLYGMIEAFPLQRVIPMVFKGSGDCAAVDWTFLGGSIANWSFVTFVLLGAGAVLGLIRQRQAGSRSGF